MNWRSNLIRAVGIPAVLLALSGCSQDGSNDPPPKSNLPIKLESRPSTVAIPISASIADLQVKLNEQVPNPILPIDQEKDNCIPARYTRVCVIWIPRPGEDYCGGRKDIQVSPNISCRIKGEVSRGQITLSGEGQTLRMAMPVSVRVSAKDIGGVIRSPNATGSVDVRASVAIDIDENWSPTAAVSADYSWNDKIGVDILGQRITFSSKVDPKLKNAIDQFQGSIPAQIEAIGLKERLSEAWTKGFAAIQLSDKPSAWLRFTPSAVGYSGYEVSNGEIRLSLLAKGVTETFLGPKPTDPRPTPLPKLVKDLPPEGFKFFLPIIASYNTLEEEAEKALRIGEEQTFDVPTIGKVKVTFSNVTVYQTVNGALAIGVEMNANPPNEFFDTKGTVWLSAVPRIDNKNRVAAVDNIRFVSRTDNESFDLLASILGLPIVNSRVKRAMTYDFNQKYATALTRANTALKREIAENLFLDGEITNAYVDRIVATPEGLYLGLEVTGTAALRYENLAK